MKLDAYLLPGVMLLAIALAGPAPADERPEHYDGVPAPTLEVALANLREALLESGELSAEDLHHVHRLSYTLENALERLRGELATAADDLEALHLASETAEPEVVRRRGEAYLQVLGTLTD